MKTKQKVRLKSQYEVKQIHRQRTIFTADLALKSSLKASDVFK
jgi:hypothetical protein